MSSFRDFYFNRITLIWNSLPENFKDSDTISSFKSKLKAFYFTRLLNVFDGDDFRSFITIVLQNVFATAFFLIKEFIANRKMIPLISFMENVLGMSQLKHFSHHSQGSVREIYLALGETVNQNLLKKARSAKSFGILIDAVTDISVSTQLISFLQFCSLLQMWSVPQQRKIAIKPIQDIMVKKPQAGDDYTKFVKSTLYSPATAYP